LIKAQYQIFFFILYSNTYFFFFFWSQIVFKYSYLNRTTYVTLFSFQTLKVLSKSQNKIHQLIQTYQCCKYCFAYQEEYFLKVKIKYTNSFKLINVCKYCFVYLKEGVYFECCCCHMIMVKRWDILPLNHKLIP
jgi:hypothetical protein